MRRTGTLPLGASLAPIDLFSLNPFSLMRRMTEEMDRVFGESGRGGNSGTGTAIWAPAIEVSEQDGNYVINAELPGLKPEEVKVEVTDDGLVVQGERKFEREEDQGGVHRTELRYGRFYRVIPLPEGAKIDQARARFENGVLQVTVPVSEQQSQRRQIPVEASSAASAGTSSAGASSAGTSEKRS